MNQENNNPQPSPKQPEFDLTQQLNEVRREILIRRSVYPKWVESPTHKLTQAVADRQIALMTAVERTIENLIELTIETAPAKKELLYFDVVFSDPDLSPQEKKQLLFDQSEDYDRMLSEKIKRTNGNSEKLLAVYRDVCAAAYQILTTHFPQREGAK